MGHPRQFALKILGLRHHKRHKLPWRVIILVDDTVEAVMMWKYGFDVTEPFIICVTYCTWYCGVTLTVSSVALRPVGKLTVPNPYYIRSDGSRTHEDTQRFIASINTGSQTKVVFVSLHLSSMWLTICDANAFRKWQGRFCAQLGRTPCSEIWSRTPPPLPLKFEI